MPGGKQVLRICENCGIEFFARARTVAAGHGRFHDRNCWLESFGTLDDRLSKYIPEQTGQECQEWQSTCNEHGYGLIHIRSISTDNLLVHRVVWEQAYGPIPEGLKVLHHCDNPPCVRLDHLFLGTMADNTDDMITKGRAVFGGRPIGSDRKARRSPN